MLDPAGTGPGHVVRGLRTALAVVVGALLLGLVAAGVWVGIAGGPVTDRLGISLLVLAGLITLFGSSLVARLGTSEARAFLGRGPEGDQADLAAGLGPMGVFRFIAVPLAVAGLFLAS